MTVTGRRRARAAPKRVHTKPHLPLTYTTSLRTSSRWSFGSPRHSKQQPIEHLSEGTAAVHSAVRYGECCLGSKPRHVLRVDHDPQNKRSLTISEWLDRCNIDLYENGVNWPCDMLDEIPDLRFLPKRTSGQCIDWQIFKDDRVVQLPSFEELVPRLDVGACRDAWFLEEPIKLKKERFEDLKAHLLKGTLSKIRLLNVPVTEGMVGRGPHRQHSVMVRERAQHFYIVGKDHHVEVHHATTNVTPRGTATEIHHDSDPHISTACGESGASFEHPMKLWLLWDASQSHRLATCYSNTAVALRHMGPCGYLVQYSGESIMLPANVPHAALSLSPHYLYGQTFHVKGRARDPTTLDLDLSARAKPLEALDTVLTCYEEGLQDPDPHIRAIHIDHAVRTISSMKAAPRQVHIESNLSKVVEVLRKNRKFNGVCGLCEHFRLSPQSDIDCWTMHDVYENKLRVRNGAS